MPNIGFTICHLPFLALGFSRLKGHLYFTPPGQCSSECWSNLSAAGGHQGQLWARLSEAWTIQCALRTRYVQLLSGFFGTSGRCCWICFTLSKLSCRTGMPSLIGMSWDKVYPSLTVRACDGLCWDTPAGYKLSKAVPAVMWQMGIC